MKNALTMLVVGLLLGPSAACADRTPPLRTDALRALERTLGWLAAHRPDPERAPMAYVGMDAWTWNLFSRLHPDPSVRARAAERARVRLRSVDSDVESTVVALSWRAVLLRGMEHQRLDTAAHRAALAELDLGRVLAGAEPTTRLWTVELLRHSGVEVGVSTAGSFIATGAVAEGYTPRVRDAYRLYHEIAPATDLGRAPPRAFSPAELAFAKRVLPGLLEVSRSAGDTDAAAEVLIVAALLGEHAPSFYSEGVAWLLGQQRDDGTYRAARDRRRAPSVDDSRHAALVVSWALLEFVSAF